MRHRIFETFTGPFALIHRDDGSIRTTWVDQHTQSDFKNSRLDSRLLPELSARLKNYFAGDDVDFSDVEVPAGGAFYRRCWRKCREIPRGETISYAELAARAGSANAARAAGQSMRNNPLPIITPCHRVVGAGGVLHGFGGSCDAASQPLHIKRLLLEMEAGLAVSA
jgi:methylated-DNA-[protein]-cysteine S-methyltransferase